MAVSFYRRYLALLDGIERRFPVADWRRGDLHVWPLARMDLYLDMYWADAGVAAPRQRPLSLRIAGRLAMPLRNLWNGRDDPGSRVVRPSQAYAIFLGDGTSLDFVAGAWRDRFGEPLIAALEARGLTTFLMQSGYSRRLPWHRPTFAANLVESRGFLKSLFTRSPLELPAHGDVLQFLASNAVDAPSLTRTRLERRANVVAATASSFEAVLRAVRPTLAFVVAGYAGLGPAFLLACRRQGILSIDLQRSPHGGLQHAYFWPAVPACGYATLPSVFWSWTKGDAARIDDWTRTLAAPLHGAIHGGHTQLTPYLDDRNAETRAWDARFATIGGGATYEREILVALQPLHGHRAVWEALRAQIEASPTSWRWWIRRHPASRPDQDVEVAQLLELRPPNVLVTEATMLPLPALLRHTSAVLSLASGAAVEASMFGVPALFLSDAARHTFADLLARGAASVVDVRTVNQYIAKLEAKPRRPSPQAQPDVAQCLLQLDERAAAHRRLRR
jgi:hypothetical protein